MFSVIELWAIRVMRKKQHFLWNYAEIDPSANMDWSFSVYLVLAAILFSGVEPLQHFSTRSWEAHICWIVLKLINQPKRSGQCIYFFLYFQLLWPSSSVESSQFNSSGTGSWKDFSLKLFWYRSFALRAVVTLSLFFISFFQRWRPSFSVIWNRLSNFGTGSCEECFCDLFWNQ